MGNIIVLGATGGIGSELIRQLAAEGEQLMLFARNEERLRSLADETGSEFVVGNASNADDVATLFEKALALRGTIDGVAHCIGSLLLKPAHLTSDEEWNSVLQINLTTAFNVVRMSARVMKEGGSVVLISSAAARRGLANHEAIAAAKAGIIGLCLAAAATYAKHQIRFNCVAPGMVRTPLTRSLIENEAVLKYSTDLHALGRIGEPTDVANAIRWLLSPEASWVTGQVIGVDGGLATVQPR